MTELSSAPHPHLPPAGTERRQPIGLRTRLAALVLGATLPLLALTVLLTIRSYQAERHQIEQHTIETARALALAVDRELSGLQSAIVALSLSRELQKRDFADFYDQAQEMLRRVAATNVIVSDGEGQEILNTQVKFGLPLPKRSNLDGIRKAARTGEPVVSDLYTGAVSNRPAIGIDIPVQTDAGVVFLTIGVPLQRLDEIVHQQRLPQNWIISLLDSSGAIVARTVKIDQFLGRKAAPELIAALSGANEGATPMHTLEGLSVVAAFSRSGISGWTAVIGIPSAELAAPMRRSLLVIGAAAALLLLGGLALAALLARRIEQPIQALVAPALALGRGEPVAVPPLRLREAHQLGHALATAGQLLKAREQERDRAEAQLRESEARFRVLADSAPVMIWMSGGDKDGVYFNKVWLDFTGRTLEEELGGRWTESVHLDDQTELQACADAFEARRPFQTRFRLRRHDGAWRWVLDTGIPRFEADGTFAGFIGSCLDITESQVAEAALRESEARLRISEERFRVLSQSSMEGVAIHDGERILDANDRFAALFGYRPEEAIGRSPFDFVPPGARGEVIRRTAALSMEPYESVGLRKDGSTFPVEFWGRPLFYHGRTVRVGVVRDLTEAKRAAAALRHSELRYRTLVDATASIVWTTDASGNFVSPQESWAQFTGQSWPDYAGDGWLDVVHPEDRKASRERWPAAVSSRTAYTMENRLWHARTASYRWVSTRAVPIHDSDGTVLEWIGTITDVDAGRRTADELRRLNDTLETRVNERTGELALANERLRSEMLERLRIEEVLSQAQKMEAIGHMTGGVAHDFNNLLTVVVGNLEMIERSPGADERARRLAGAALSAAGRGERLTQQLLAFARRQTLHPRVLDLNRLIRDFEPLLRRALGEGIELSIDLEPKDATCKIDPSQFETALLNLIVNARDASPAGSTVTISTRRRRLERDDAGLPHDAAPGTYIQVSVSDEGSGISAEILPRVFEPFFTTKEVGKGSGLGLSQVYGFVRQSGGIITIESEPRQGTNLRILLPASTDAAAKEERGRPDLSARLEGRSIPGR